MAPTANLKPVRNYPSRYEPVHGTAPDINAQPNPNHNARFWAGAVMLDLLTQGQGAGRAAHDAIVKAIEHVIAHGPRTPDLGGQAHTEDVGQAIVDHLKGL
jgi:tartrate dehydrogenase/decarboxylase/D-malate dehydrogenase